MQIRRPVAKIPGAAIFEEEGEEHYSIDPDQTMFQFRHSVFTASNQILRR